MGHTHLGSLPRTRKWRQVVAFILAGADATQVSNAVIVAAEKALAKAVDDPAVIESIWLLMKLPADAREGDFVAALRHTGLDVSDRPSLLEIVTAVSECIEASARRRPGRTDLGDMAQTAAVESLSSLMSESRQARLFETTTSDVRAQLAKLHTVKQFGMFARKYFARLTEKCLGYFLSRELANHVGAGGRFTTLSDLQAFNEAIGRHCFEASRIVQDFAGEWLSKTTWEKKGISKQEATSFAYVAMKKMREELQQGAR